MKKIYVSPNVCVYAVMGQSLLEGSIKLGGSSEKVSSGDEIGFVREESFQDDDSWD